MTVRTELPFYSQARYGKYWTRAFDTFMWDTNQP